MTKLTRTLKVGDSGEDIKQLQTRLKEKGIFPYPIDGFFSQNLLLSVTHFQKTIGIDIDGEVGYQTWSNLFT